MELRAPMDLEVVIFPGGGQSPGLISKHVAISYDASCGF